jgi:hypothetical protein
MNRSMNMDVEMIYRQADGSQTILGIRKMDGIPDIGKPFELDDRQFVAKSYSGPDAQGRYRLFLEDEPGAMRH